MLAETREIDTHISFFSHSIRHLFANLIVLQKINCLVFLFSRLYVTENTQISCRNIAVNWPNNTRHQERTHLQRRNGHGLNIPSELLQHHLLLHQHVLRSLLHTHTISLTKSVYTVLPTFLLELSHLRAYRGRGYTRNLCRHEITQDVEHICNHTVLTHHICLRLVNFVDGHDDRHCKDKMED